MLWAVVEASAVSSFAVVGIYVGVGLWEERIPHWVLVLQEVVVAPCIVDVLLLIVKGVRRRGKQRQGGWSWRKNRRVFGLTERGVQLSCHLVSWQHIWLRETLD